jgi:hypothetical protein
MRIEREAIMDKKLMWFFSVLLAMLIATLTTQYIWSGRINPAYLLGILAGSAIAWIFLATPRKAWLFWVGTLFWVIFIPVGVVGLARWIASRLSVETPLWAAVGIGFLTFLAMLVYLFHNAARFRLEGGFERPVLDERHQYHFGVSGYWAFLFLNGLIIAALIQPWVSPGQIGLWIGVLVMGLIFWIANLIFLEWKR